MRYLDDQDFCKLPGYQRKYNINDTVACFYNGEFLTGIVTQQGITLDEVTVATASGERYINVSYVRPGNTLTVTTWLQMLDNAINEELNQEWEEAGLLISTYEVLQNDAA